MSLKLKHKKARNHPISIKKVLIGSNFISQIFFFWVFCFILTLRKTKDLKNLCFLLKNTETTAYNDDLLEKRWKEEKERAVKLNR